MVRLTDRPDMTLDVYRGRKTTMQQQQQLNAYLLAVLWSTVFRRSLGLFWKGKTCITAK